MSETFGDKLRALRLKADKSQVEAAAGIGASQGTYSSWESRETAVRGEVLQRIVSYFHVSPSYFYQDDMPARDGVARAREWLDYLRNRGRERDDAQP